MKYYADADVTSSLDCLTDSSQSWSYFPGGSYFHSFYIIPTCYDDILHTGFTVEIWGDDL